MDVIILLQKSEALGLYPTEEFHRVPESEGWIWGWGV